jgi:hypothetical protein
MWGIVALHPLSPRLFQVPESRLIPATPDNKAAFGRFCCYEERVQRLWIFITACTVHRVKHGGREMSEAAFTFRVDKGRQNDFATAAPLSRGPDAAIYSAPAEHRRA